MPKRIVDCEISSQSAGPKEAQQPFVMVGQTALRSLISRNLREDTVLPHLLIRARSGMGKTTLVRWIVDELNPTIIDTTECLEICCRDVVNTDDWRRRIFWPLTDEGRDTLVLVFDAIEALPRMMVKDLFLPLERSVFSLGEGGEIALKPFTIVAFVEDTKKLSEPFRRLFPLFAEMAPYTDSELAEIACAHCDKLTHEAVEALLPYASGRPKLLVELVHALVVRETGAVIDLPQVHDFLSLRGLVPQRLEGPKALLDPGDFEQLVGELLRRLFVNAEVTVTRQARDGGIDVVVEDRDPIRGGLYIVQAKRYEGIVPPSAVRDLYGTVHSEDAVKGILVTTGDFGPDAYTFARGKRLELINGERLKALQRQHGLI